MPTSTYRGKPQRIQNSELRTQNSGFNIQKLKRSGNMASDADKAFCPDI
jgi:hypothetical protein